MSALFILFFHLFVDCFGKFVSSVKGQATLFGRLFIGHGNAHEQSKGPFGTLRNRLVANNGRNPPGSFHNAKESFLDALFQHLYSIYMTLDDSIKLCFLRFRFLVREGNLGNAFQVHIVLVRRMIAKYPRGKFPTRKRSVQS